MTRTHECLLDRVMVHPAPDGSLGAIGWTRGLQAHVPLGQNSLKMGTPDGGRTVLNSSPNLENATRLAAEKLGLRSHTVGGRLVWEAHRDEETDQMKKRKRNVGGQVLHTAADVEGHEGSDSR